MNITDRARDLTRKFASSAPCGKNLEPLQGKMFWIFYLKITKKMGLGKITKKAVMRYWIKYHNNLLITLMMKEKINPQRVLECLVRAGGTENHLFCFHGGTCICPITKQQASFLYEQFKRFRDASQI